MAKNDKPRLCGGTFFTLLLEDRKQRAGVRNRFAGGSDGRSDPDIMIALIEVLYPDYQKPTMSMRETFDSNVSKYKACKNQGGTYMPFTDKATVKAIKEYVEREYQSALNAMCGVTESYLDINTRAKKDERLVKALVDLIKLDESIETDQEFFVLEDGGVLTKAQIIQAGKICFEPFLLGVWYYAALRKEGNRIGETTYDEWCPKAGGGPREYGAHLGENLDHEIMLSYSVPKEVCADAVIEENDNDSCDDTAKECTHDETFVDGPETIASQVVEQQVINQNPTFFNFNITGDNHQFFQNAEIVNIYHGEKKDE